MFSCKQNTSSDSKNAATDSANLKIINDSTILGWTAYKTTDKIAVKGIFQEYKIENIGDGENVKDILDGTSVIISPSSVFSKDTSRDIKLKYFFFDKMLGDIKATLNFDQDSAFLTVSMNGIDKKFPVLYTVADTVFTLESNIQLADFDALNALSSLHEVCKDKHTGPDGVSKTWEDVGINARVVFTRN